MTKHISVCILTTGAFVAGTFVPVAWSQAPIQGTGEYAVLNCMKVPVGKAAEYVALERDVYKAAHQARVRDGKMKSWSLWQKRFTGSEDACSFMTINTFNRFEDMEAGVIDYVQ